MAKIKTFNILVLVSIVILIFITLGYFSIQKNEKAVISKVLDAVPLDAAFIIETNNISSLYKKISQNNISEHAINIKQLSELKSQFIILDSIINNSSTLFSIFKKNKIIVSAHSLKNNELNFLIAFNISPKKKEKKLIDNILKHTNSDSSNIITYSNTKIFSFVNKNNKRYYYAITESIYITSSSLSLLKSAIRQKNSNNPISLDIGFKKIAILGKNNIHLFVNYNNLTNYFKSIFSSSMIYKSNNLSKIANWSAFDIFIKDNTLSMIGKTYCHLSANMYLNMFKSSKPQKFDAQKIIPYKTAEFLFLTTNDFANFYSNYEKYISSKNKLSEYNNLAKKYTQNNKVKILSGLLPLLDKSIIFVNVKFNNSINKYSRFILLKTTKIDDFHIIIDKLYNNSPKYEETQLDNSKKIKIYNISTKKFLKIFIGELANFPDFNYFTYYENYVIFGESIKDLKDYRNSIYRKKTLAYNADFAEFEKSLAPKMNIFYFTNNNFSALTQISALKPKYQDVYNKNLLFFKNLQFISIQYATEKKNIFTTTTNIFFNKKTSNNGLTVWETELKNNILTKPLFFINHYSYEKEVVVADEQNIIYLINKNGKILWKKQINEKIVGDIQTIDFYNNKKNQIIFCTKSHIITLDRNGKLVKDKTIKLPDSTEYGITIVDYEKNKDYRFFVPCMNNSIYLFDKNLKQVAGWKMPKTTSKIVSKIQYFNSDGKDYLVFAEKSKIHILNRKGEERIAVNKNFSFSNNTTFYFQKQTTDTKANFITTNASGNIISIFLNGTIKTKKLITVTSSHFFVASDINSDELKDYIFADGKNLFVYNNDGKGIFSYTFEDEILIKPIILKFSSENIKIGITIKNKNQIILLNTNGTIESNFPIQGNSSFSVGFLSSKKKFSLIVGYNNYIYNYILY
ncbi:MAG: hypothetical protein U9Q83_12320 [Bacteroidota bacterium]|nr:hypothetical protein [Bacteroidota bacterium]